MEEFERELQDAASRTHPPNLSLEKMNSVALAKLAGSEVTRIRILTAGPSLRDPDKAPFVTAQDEIEKVRNAIVWEAGTYPGWSEVSSWNRLALGVLNIRQCPFQQIAYAQICGASS